MHITHPPKTSQPADTDQPGRLARLKRWLKKHLWAVICVIAALIISGVFIFALYSIQHTATNDSSLILKKKEKPTVYYSPLTGEVVPDEAATKQAVTGVMIENSPDARPQSGLKKAGIVYEAAAEGGITRFLALYQGVKPAQIGPVRSLRIYYLGWAAPYQASIAHVGGSGNALATVRNGSYRDIDQFSNGGAYWRAGDRRPPHNMYTSGERLDALNNAKGFHESQFSGFLRTDGKPAENPSAQTITVHFSSPLYTTGYHYDKASNSYARSLAGTPHTDREAGNLAPQVLVVLEVQAERRTGPDGYDDLVTTGSGKATIFQNGTATEATWKRDGFNAPLKLVDRDGKDITLNRGQTWIAAFTPGRGSLAWQ